MQYLILWVQSYNKHFNLALPIYYDFLLLKPELMTYGDNEIAVMGHLFCLICYIYINHLLSLQGEMI